MSAFWRHVTDIPVEPIVRLAEKVQADVPVVVVVEPEVTAVPVRDALTFAIVVLSAPNDERSERIDETCALVKAAACTIGANESIDVAIASPVATAATFAAAIVVTFFITMINYFKTHIISKFE
jgi:hypothetical protein